MIHLLVFVLKIKMIFCPMSSENLFVDQPGLIHGISLSLLAKYLPFVLIVCVAEM